MPAITIFQQMPGGAGMLNQFLRQHDIRTWDIATDPDTFALLLTSQAVWKEAGRPGSSRTARTPPGSSCRTRTRSARC
ncbi:hypothetical protein [Kitasatospora sp. NPDC050463]|uniref:hypothetical protein n=1 Tax=Kitasatospora sp. NPDC050463 TaxID=3155786 RepID=UPI0033D1B505